MIHKRRKKRKKQIEEENFNNILNLYKKSKENPIQNKEQISQNIKQRNIDVIKLTPKLTHFKEKRLKQTKLKFHLNNSENESSDTIAFKHINKKLIKPLTSTPIHQNKQNSSDSITSTSISDITITKNNSDIDRK